MPLNYTTYLQIEELLDLQHPRSSPAEHDEMLFIVIHQVYELWFKLMLQEFEKVCADFRELRLFEVIHTFKRCRTIMKTLVGQLDILETMTPMSFSSFRQRLETASGFQSTQFREFEFLLGYKRPQVMKYCAEGTPAYEAMKKRLHAPSIIDHLYDFLEANGVEIPAAARAKDPTAMGETYEEIEDGVYMLYTTRPDIAILFELMTDFDEGIQEWRYRHVKIVERTIGSKHGTGGSPGVEFLKKSLFTPVFADLWTIRHRL
ncbi:MAG: hypothetical protein KC983_04575 [Phycisphaerales bacterium]|nr:hypothetical protein [Phycisphaerales bacterium]